MPIGIVARTQRKRGATEYPTIFYKDSIIRDEVRRSEILTIFYFEQPISDATSGGTTHSPPGGTEERGSGKEV